MLPFLVILVAFLGLVRGHTYNSQNLNLLGYAALTRNGGVVSWGGSEEGYFDLQPADLSSGVLDIYSTESGWAALKADGKVVTWRIELPDDVATELTSGVTKLFSSMKAFAALKDNGRLITWGVLYAGGDSSSVAASLRSGVVFVVGTDQALAALKDDGSVVAWGEPDFGGYTASVAAHLTSGVTMIYGSHINFAALKTDNTLIFWGQFAPASPLLIVSGVAEVQVTMYTFGILRKDGCVEEHGYGSASGLVATDVAQIYSSRGTYHMIRTDGSAATLGPPNGISQETVAAQLSSGVVKVFCTQYATAALKSDGSVVTWGDNRDGGDSSAVATSISSGVVHIVANYRCFAALKNDSSVVAWGDPPFGGDTSPVAASLSSGVVSIHTNGMSFVAVKDDGSVVTWGYPFSGANTSSVDGHLVDIVALFGTGMYEQNYVQAPPTVPTALSAHAGSGAAAEL